MGDAVCATIARCVPQGFRRDGSARPRASATSKHPERRHARRSRRSGAKQQTLARVLVDRPLTRIEYRVPRLARRARTLRGAARHCRHITRQGAVDRLLERPHSLQPQPALRRMARRRDERPRPRLLDKRATSVRVLIETSTHAAVLLSATQIELLNAPSLRTSRISTGSAPTCSIARRRSPRSSRGCATLRSRDARWRRCCSTRASLQGWATTFAATSSMRQGCAMTMRPADFPRMRWRVSPARSSELPRQSFAPAARRMMRRSSESSGPRAFPIEAIGASSSTAAKGCLLDLWHARSVASTSAVEGSISARAVSPTGV